MNPSSRKNPLDGAKYREQYLSNLRLQASNDQRNQNANAIFKKTGQTPSRPPDTRTTTEKSGDIEGMKVDLRSKLSQITDGVIASQIIGELNTDQIRFAINNWGTILPDMNRQFGNGVPTSAFIAYLNRLIDKFQVTEGVETGLQQNTGRAILMSNTQILYGLPKSQIFNVLRGVLDTAQRQFGINVNPLLFAIQQNEYILPNLEQSQVLNGLPPEVRAEVLEIANKMYDNVADNKQIADIISELNIGLANRDKRFTENVVDNATETLALDDSVIAQKDEIVRLVNNALRGGSQDDGRFIEGGTDEFPKMEEVETEPSKTFEELFSGSATRATPEFSAKPETAKKSSSEDKIPDSYTQIGWEKIGSKNTYQKTLFLTKVLERDPDLVLEDLNGKKYGMSITRGGKARLPSNFEGTLSNKILNSLFEDYLSKSSSSSSSVSTPRPQPKRAPSGGAKESSSPSGEESGSGFKKGKMVGMGVSHKKPYRQSITHLVDRPIEKPKPYTPFGRYYINKMRLEGEGIVAFRQPSGNTLSSLPTEKISRPLTKVMRVLIGKGIPSYEEIAELSKGDKIKLNHICKTCMVDNPALPKMKGEGEQEEDRFNILRGEIIAGNDNKQIAKEFKVMLMKFMTQGRIPRRQANEILGELLAMGI